MWLSGLQETARSATLQIQGAALVEVQWGNRMKAARLSLGSVVGIPLYSRRLEMCSSEIAEPEWWTGSILVRVSLTAGEQVLQVYEAVVHVNAVPRIAGDRRRSNRLEVEIHPERPAVSWVAAEYSPGARLPIPSVLDPIL